MITIITVLWECGHHDCTLSSQQPSAICFSLLFLFKRCVHHTHYVPYTSTWLLVLYKRYFGS